MKDLIFAESDFESIKKALVGHGVERAGVIFTNKATSPNGEFRLLVKSYELATETSYSRQSNLEAELHPQFVADVTKRAISQGNGLVFVHSHPGDHPPEFSHVDNEGERHLSDFLRKRHDVFHGALVFSKGGIAARRLGGTEQLRVITVGTDRKILSEPDDSKYISEELFDRQVRIFGSGAQKILGDLRIGIVGLGGTGSIVSQQLVHLGVRDFILIDPDTIETSNLNRVANARHVDVGSPKVDVAARYIQETALTSKVRPICGDIIYAKVAKELIACDVIFACTDSHGSRSVIQQLSYQFLIPCIDMGTTIAVSKSNQRITHIFGRTQLLAPGHACLSCSGLLDSNEIRRDMMTAFERQADPYIQGAREPAPAVMPLNSTIASISVSMLLSIVAGVPMAGRHFLYNAIQSTLRSARANSDPDCYICSKSGALAQGDAWPIPGRQD